MGLLRWQPRPHRQQRPRAIQGLHLTLFIQAEHQRVVRRIEIEADDVADFLDKLRVAESLNVSTRWVCNPKVCQIREIVAFENATVSAMERVLHWVACDGGPSRVRVMRSTTISSVTVRGAPGRGSSTSPSRRRTQKTCTPLADAVTRHVQAGSHRSIRQTVRTRQHHTRTQG